VPDLGTEAYHYVEVVLPTGRTIRAKPLPWKHGLRWLGILTDYEVGKLTLEQSVVPVLEEFPTVLGITGDDLQELEALSLGEIYSLVKRFLFLRRTPPTRATPPLVPPTLAQLDAPSPSAPS